MRRLQEYRALLERGYSHEEAVVGSRPKSELAMLEDQSDLIKTQADLIKELAEWLTYYHDQFEEPYYSSEIENALAKAKAVQP
jgi:hypothetical protein